MLACCDGMVFGESQSSLRTRYGDRLSGSLCKLRVSDLPVPDVDLAKLTCFSAFVATFTYLSKDA